MELDIEKAISSLFVDEQPKELYEPIIYTLKSGGKRLRPMLAIIAHKMFGGNGVDALPIAKALEVFHNFTLLHDDIMDRADTRRNMPTVHVKWDDATAILSGDAMLIESYRLLGEMPKSLIADLLPVFSEMALEICKGQQYDKNFETAEVVSLAEYIDMIRLKTAVLLANALKLGAMAAGAPQQDVELLYNLGTNIGIAFQLQDDFLDLYGDPQTFGKPIGGDIACNKKTFLTILAQQHCSQQDVEALRQIITSDMLALDDKLVAVRSIYATNNIPTHYEETLNKYMAEAERCLAQLNVRQEDKEPLIKLINKLKGRNK